MNRDDIERELLLAASGELSDRRKRKLERYLATSEEGRTLQSDIQRITDVTRSALKEDGPAPSTITRIMNEARQGARERSEPLAFIPRSAYAIAAVLALGFSIWLTIQRPTTSVTQVATLPAEELPAWDDDIDSQLEALDELVLAMQTESVAIYETSEEQDTESLARELLLLEGEEI